MKKRVRISVSVIVIALVLCCLVPLIGVTYGLFEETITTENHLVAGSLKATLVRERLTSNSVDSSGFLTSVTDDNEKDFTKSTGDNIFGIDDSVLLVPGSSFIAEMKIGNKGDVAFYYYVEVFFDAVISDSSFASMLKLSVTSKNGAMRETLIKDGLTLGDDDLGLGIVEVGASDTFTVKLEFLDSDLNNKAKNKFVKFDLRVHAVQKINAD